MSGKLADGTHFSQGSRISKNGQWPLYVALYGRKGSIMSWITFSNFPATTLGGELVWFKPASPHSKFFTAGLTNQSSTIGSSFVGPIPSHGRQQLNFRNAVVVFEGGDLPSAITNAEVGTVFSGTNRLKLKWDSISGLVRGSFTHPLTGKNTTLRGVVLQNQGTARGYFLGTTQSGSFELKQQSGL